MTEATAPITMMLRTEIVHYNHLSNAYTLWITLHFRKRRYTMQPDDIELVNQINTAVVRPALVINRQDIDAIRVGETWYHVVLDEPKGF